MNRIMNTVQKQTREPTVSMSTIKCLPMLIELTNAWSVVLMICFEIYIALGEIRVAYDSVI